METAGPAVGRRDDRFAGKVALVVGAGSANEIDLDVPSVGAAISLVFARGGARVGVLGLGPEGAPRTVELLAREGGEAFPIAADVTVEADCERAVAAVMDRFGRLDYLVNNLGFRIQGTSLATVTEGEWDQVMDTNVKGPLLMSKHAVPHIGRGGSIVNISGEISYRPTYASSIAYAASKGALNTITITLAVQLAQRGIRVNAVSPGNIFTPLAVREMRKRGVDPDQHRVERLALSPLGLEGTAWDVAHATAFLASDEARWMTGQVLSLEGGAMLPSPAAVRPKA